MAENKGQENFYSQHFGPFPLFLFDSWRFTGD